MRVLLVEDNKVDHFITSHMILEFFEHAEIVWAVDGLEAIEILSSNNDFDFILLDINMPRVSGLEFLERYKEGFTEHLYTFPLSSSKNPKDINKAMSYDFVNKFLHKPIGNEALKEIVSIVT